MVMVKMDTAMAMDKKKMLQKPKSKHGKIVTR
jgi:hypothetical protein